VGGGAGGLVLAQPQGGFGAGAGQRLAGLDAGGAREDVEGGLEIAEPDQGLGAGRGQGRILTSAGGRPGAGGQKAAGEAGQGGGQGPGPQARHDQLGQTQRGAVPQVGVQAGGVAGGRPEVQSAQGFSLDLVLGE